MTTLRDYSPVLDRLIRREVSTEVEVAGAVTYTFDAEYLGGGTDSLDDGTWVRASDTSIVIGLNDSNGIAFPVDLSIPSIGVEVSWDDGAVVTLDITALLRRTTGFNFRLTALQLTFDGTLPVAGTSLAIVLPTAGTQTVTQTTERNVWAQRRDYHGRDFLQVSSGTGSLFTIASTRFIVRAEGPAWSTGDTFTDDKGERQVVQGIGEIGGRGRWLELLVQQS